MANATEGRAARLVQKGILGVLLFGSVGTLAELLLIGHTEDWWQIAPLLLLGLVVVASAFQLVRPGHQSRLVVIGVMVAAIVGGLAGHWLHYDGNAEFEREIFPDCEGIELFKESMTGATPVLAPGTMTVIGLLGLVAVWRPQGMR